MIPKHLPKKFYKFFWDTPLEQLNLDTHRRYVAERLLENGNVESVVWLKKTFGKDFIIGIVKTSRSISRKTANFFHNIYNIPKEEILCFQEDFRQKHRQIWID
ncbi:MAG: hypothetical protein UY17_C0005G0003 [Candidatus Beckwithbacteria bacterium GW2011_GWC2_47_9]|uniref:DUF6922 domain-containing protein n=2 Tax=Candidatus Beckwithiibacteriota TaxID=1752726 RepID=A0A0G1U1K8_9BACT|nr:MAG: hypothetical protein UY17_C0005G0003 [Candidatus Beckwithbacteria bacterium GW2011_GWC2_47_9]OGD59946.1 MAG: hypothetical protein A3I57_03930 [Candidatus Beckwithbacteria bacterium RIFCSPLOWO2_02_FULL_47_23]